MNYDRLGILTTTDIAERDITFKRFKQESKSFSPQIKIEPIFLANTSLAITNKGKLLFYYKKEDFTLPKVILSRIGAIVPSYGLYVLNHLSKLPDIKLFNRIEGVSIARDKFRTLQLLAESGYTVPRSLLLGQDVDLEWAIDKVGGCPAILKLNKGEEGVGVMIVDSMASARSVFDTLSKLKQKVMIQQFLTTEPGADYRLFMLGGKVLAGMKRVAKRKHEFRANIAQGAKGEKFVAPPELAKRAEAIVKLIGLDVAGIDFIFHKDYGYVPIEVNANPGFDGLEKATGLNIAKTIIEFCLTTR